MAAYIAHCESFDNSEITYCGIHASFALRNVRAMEGNNLKQVRKRRGLKQPDVAERLGVSVPQISRWEAGIDNIPSSRLSKMAEAYECSIAEMFGETQPLGPRLYIKGEVAAGVWKEAWEVDPDDWEAFTGRADIAASVRERFGLRIVGQSMNEVYPEGSIIECVAYDHEEPIPTGKRVVVVQRDFHGSVESTVKELHRDEQGIEWLVPRSTNPAFQTPLRADQPGEGIEEVAIVAIVVASIRPE